jgi:hypothetical protein
VFSLERVRAKGHGPEKIIADKTFMTYVKTLIKTTLCAVLALGFLVQANAEDKKVDGTYSWAMPSRNGAPERKMTLKLKTEGDKLTGTVTSPGRQGGQPVETKIEDGKVKGEDISFSVTREFNNNKMTSKYVGKLTAEGIKGKMSFDRQGQEQSRDWEAKKAAPAAK